MGHQDVVISVLYPITPLIIPITMSFILSSYFGDYPYGLTNSTSKFITSLPFSSLSSLPIYPSGYTHHPVARHACGTWHWALRLLLFPHSLSLHALALHHVHSLPMLE